MTTSSTQESRRESDARQRRNEALRTEGSDTAATMAGVGDDPVTPSGPDETEGEKPGSRKPAASHAGKRTFRAKAAALFGGLFRGRVWKGR